jgi:hypothetical protein
LAWIVVSREPSVATVVVDVVVEVAITFVVVVVVVIMGGSVVLGLGVLL